MNDRERRRLFERIESDVVACRRCPRLNRWREEAALHPPRRFAGQVYWARPVPAFGDPLGRIVIVGLAPAAHGGNRTGRIFTGDESGKFLFAALHAVGLANQPESIAPGDGLELTGAFITATARCAPPGNKPLPSELHNCREYIRRELALAARPRVLVALGGIAFASCLGILAEEGAPIPSPRPRFEHGARYAIGGDVLLATYHPSQQNTFTGKLTQPMLRAVLRSAVREGGRAASGRISRG
ncbi:MAG TPA: uracil-DNA glycosylase [Thermoanaerobaculia bacterium]|nr:uracil-DNA glycosylase [Thermoanaerobaculia bacterium]